MVFEYTCTKRDVPHNTHDAIGEVITHNTHNTRKADHRMSEYVTYQPGENDMIVASERIWMNIPP